MKAIATFAVLGLVFGAEDHEFLNIEDFSDQELRILPVFEKDFRQSHLRGISSTKPPSNDDKHTDVRKFLKEKVKTAPGLKPKLNASDKVTSDFNKKIDQLDDIAHDDSLFSLNDLLKEVGQQQIFSLLSNKKKILQFEDNNLNLWSSLKEGIKNGANWLKNHPEAITAGPQSMKKKNSNQLIRNFHDNRLFEVHAAESDSKEVCFETSQGRFCFDGIERKDDDLADNDLAQVCINTKFGRICRGK